MMHAVVLGAAAGGGFPQWNSNAPGCRRARAGDPAALPRTQTSVAVSGNGETWIVLNASPDLRVQIERTRQLHPRHGLRSTPIAAVALTGAEVDSVAGLLTLRESQPFDLLATAGTLAQLDRNPIFEVLRRDLVPRIAIAPDAPVAVESCGLRITAFAAPGKVPLYAETGLNDASDDATVGFEIGDGVRRLVFLPGCARLTDALLARLDGADALLFDATLWRDDEMIRAGLGPKTGARMGHMSVSGPAGAIAGLRGIAVERRILIHLNNSNPLLLDDSPERREAEAAGWRVAFDGMAFVL
ncbi:pyrroloquinoline quinone biosynthesis protein PqqB [Acetobacteraceae bacterium KSS8]|uniref:Coenzyme PQQ synthesis protein B n=1 Tax=Endosaccharibacter trunci TaxID=2812733 RepID=A0ABT1W8A4_9PROT|nr:pyrroloquinoline quinone biosynthesis protein PqqB [Acetobacteraceae bacterium KSS8]